MQTFSTSIIRRSSAALASFLHRTATYNGGFGAGTYRSFYFLSAKRGNRNNDFRNPQPKNNSVRSFVAPLLSWDDKTVLSLSNEAICTVLTAQADCMRVIVQEVAVHEDGNKRTSKIGFEILCVVRSMLKKIGRTVLVGDKVFVGSIDWTDRRGKIENVFDRRTENLDPPVANFDHLLVLFSLDQPKLDPNTLTRFLVEAESTKIPLTLALNKCELITEEELESWKTRLRGWNYEPLFCSVKTKVGLDEIACRLRNQTSVIVGPSGVGKSSLINVLRSNSDGSIEYGEGFKPIRKMVEGGKCEFEDCSHIGEQGCAMEDGWERYSYYLQLLDEVTVEEESQFKKYGTKKEDATRDKAGEMGVKKVKARLDPKKYRRVSRKTSKQAWISELND